jgi:hypothetical protein
MTKVDEKVYAWGEVVAGKINLHRNVICCLILWNVILTILILLK